MTNYLLLVYSALPKNLSFKELHIKSLVPHVAQL